MQVYAACPWCIFSLRLLYFFSYFVMSLGGLNQGLTQYTWLIVSLASSSILSIQAQQPTPLKGLNILEGASAKATT